MYKMYCILFIIMVNEFVFIDCKESQEYQLCDGWLQTTTSNNCGEKGISTLGFSDIHLHMLPFHLLEHNSHSIHSTMKPRHSSTKSQNCFSVKIIGVRYNLILPGQILMNYWICFCSEWFFLFNWVNQDIVIIYYFLGLLLAVSKLK